MAPASPPPSYRIRRRLHRRAPCCAAAGTPSHTPHLQRMSMPRKAPASSSAQFHSHLDVCAGSYEACPHAPHMPYREFKLTRISQESLGGWAKRCIIATVSLSPSHCVIVETTSGLTVVTMKVPGKDGQAALFCKCAARACCSRSASAAFCV
jgi:hypothetical protein